MAQTFPLPPPAAAVLGISVLAGDAASLFAMGAAPSLAAGAAAEPIAAAGFATGAAGV
ncbi:hypothetical protein D3C72_2408460 [compost metagenome]